MRISSGAFFSWDRIRLQVNEETAAELIAEQFQGLVVRVEGNDDRIVIVSKGVLSLSLGICHELDTHSSGPEALDHELWPVMLNQLCWGSGLAELWSRRPMRMKVVAKFTRK